MDDHKTADVTQLWEQQYKKVSALQTALLARLKDEQVEPTIEFEELVAAYNNAVHALPFDRLNATQVQALDVEITALLANHHSLTSRITQLRDSVLHEASQLKKTGRGVKAYQDTQNGR